MPSSGAEAAQGLQAGDAVDAHAEVDHDKIGIPTEIDGAAIDGRRWHGSLLRGKRRCLGGSG